MFKAENANKTVFSTLLGTGISLLISVVLILSASFILSMTKDPRAAVVPTAMFILYFSSFTGGAVSAKTSEGILCPVISGLVTTAMILLISIAYPGKGDMSTGIKVIAFVAIELSYLLGGGAWFFVTSQKGRKKKNRRRRR